MRSTRLALLLAALTTLAAPAHAADSESLSVFGAASLTAAFKAAGAAFEASHPGTTLAFNFAGSPTLVQQIKEGAPADVFASADEANMQKLVEAGLVAGAPQIFAQNLLQIVVGKGNPKHIAGLADLTKPGLIVILCGETVPAGRYALEAFKKAGVTPPAGSREPDVKAVVTKVGLGEADAGIVYLSDVWAASATIEGVGLPPDHNVSARYPIAALREAKHPEAARAFIDFVLSEPGKKILGDYGFLSP
jgi:molybdate transport system substrate-binding protein